MPASDVSQPVDDPRPDLGCLDSAAANALILALIEQLSGTIERSIC
jgi:hypothetical protein